MNTKRKNRQSLFIFFTEKEKEAFALFGLSLFFRLRLSASGFPQSPRSGQCIAQAMTIDRITIAAHKEPTRVIDDGRTGINNRIDKHDMYLLGVGLCPMYQWVSPACKYRIPHPKPIVNTFFKNILKISIIQISHIILILVLANSRLHARIVRNAPRSLCIAFLTSSNTRIPLDTKTPKTPLKIDVRAFGVLHCHALMPFFVVWGTTTTRATGYIFLIFTYQTYTLV